MKIKIFFFIAFFAMFSCNSPQEDTTEQPSASSTSIDVNLDLNLEQANRLAALPLKCMNTEYPNKTGVVVSKDEDVKSPKAYHPTFYGCFDWHSAVHGHWVLVYLLKEFPDLEEKDAIREALSQSLTAENIKGEIDYFHMNKYTTNFERTYGWAWLLKLAEELHTWEDAEAQEWSKNLKPLTDYIVAAYETYLPKLNYPIRVGEHSNTGFGMTFAYDYLKTVDEKTVSQLIEKRALDFYKDDKGCPITWEPSGYDFLSPCLEEADIMRRVLSKEDFKKWFETFLPKFADGTAVLEPATVSDRSDGKLVHLDGLNFSRAWVFYGIAEEYPEYAHLKTIADNHLAFSLSNIVDGDYAGEHWLASFALFALQQRR